MVTKHKHSYTIENIDNLKKKIKRLNTVPISERVNMI